MDKPNRHAIDSCCASNNFLGSSRTYVYLAMTFSGVNKTAVTPTTLGSEPRCISSSSYTYGVKLRGPLQPALAFNTIKLEGDKLADYEYVNTTGPTITSRGGQDIAEAVYENIWLSKSAGHGSGNVVAWRDDGIVRGVLSPLFIAGWINCFGQPCYPCKFVDDLVCRGSLGGGIEAFLNELGDLSDKYWENNDYVPWNGFIQDWYGIVSRKAEPITGWMIYLLFMGQYCAPCGQEDEYCGCCFFCIQKNCVEPMFTARLYGGSVLLLNAMRGIPFLKPDKLQEYYKSLESQYDYGKLDIKLNHLADEYVFFEGQASWTNGDIGLVRVNRPGSGIPGSYSEDNGEATIVSGSGTFVNVSMNNDTPVISRSGSQGFAVLDMVVSKKNELNFSGEISYPWLHVDIPNTISLEKSYVNFSYDNYNLPSIVYGGGIPWSPWSPPYYYKEQRKLMVRSVQTYGGFRVYSQIKDEYPVDIEADPLMVYYYKRYVKKIVKAPYHLYAKSGERYFRQCKLGETLKDLTPGRYYFPNPAYVNRQLGGLDGDFEELADLELVDTTENFSDYFNTYYRQFTYTPGIYKNNEALLEEIEKTKNDYAKRYENAEEYIGRPELGSASLEYGGAFEYTSENFNQQDFLNFVQNSENIAIAIENYFSIPR